MDISVRILIKKNLYNGMREGKIKERERDRDRDRDGKRDKIKEQEIESDCRKNETQLQ